MKPSTKQKKVKVSGWSDEHVETLRQLAERVDVEAATKAGEHMQKLASELRRMAVSARIPLAVLVAVGHAAQSAVIPDPDGLSENGEVFDAAKLQALPVPAELLAAERLEVIRRMGRVWKQSEK